MTAASRFSLILGILTTLVYGSPGSAASDHRLSLRSEITRSPEPLTTEKYWKIDPLQLNPHRKRWAIQRKVEISGLQSFVRGDGKFGVKASGVDLHTIIWLRPSGPWYVGVGCDAKPDPIFSTPEGSEAAAKFAAKFWEESVNSELDRLAMLLGRVSGDSSDRALYRGEEVVRMWTSFVESTLHRALDEKAFQVEWEYYKKLNSQSGVCATTGKTNANPTPRFRWEAMLERTPPQDLPKIPLARAPSRRWNGLFSVRLSVTLGGQKLNGKFLIDSTLSKSVMSPSWLEGQGILPEWVEIAGATPERVSWSGGGGIGKPGRVDHVQLSGLTIPLKEFVLIDTDFFGPPDNFSGCCDGVLGLDFLRNHVVEFRSAEPSEVRIWNRDGFSLDEAMYPWVEATISERGEVVSDVCELIPQSGAKPGLSLTGVVWDTGSEEALTIHEPYRAKLKGAGSTWGISCGSMFLARKLSAVFPAPDDSPEKFEAKPASSLGLSILARSSVFFDLPHGKIWMERSGLERASRKNTSGLQVEFVLVQGDRVLRVKEIAPQSPAADLSRRLPFKKGTEIGSVDGKAASEIDLWEVESRLKGSHGPEVVLGLVANRKAPLQEVRLPVLLADKNAL